MRFKFNTRGISWQKCGKSNRDTIAEVKAIKKNFEQWLWFQHQNSKSGLSPHIKTVEILRKEEKQFENSKGGV